MADSEKVISSSSGFGEIDHEIIEREINNLSSKRQPYVKYSPEERYKIGKYASENGPIATVRKFQQRFPNMNESTARTFRKRYESDLADAKRQGKTPSTSLPLKPQGRPFLLGEIDEMVQRYTLAASNRGSVITQGVAISTAKALMTRNPHLIGNVDVESSHSAQSLYRRMGFRRRQATTSKLEIPEGALKEVTLLFHHDIASKVEKFSILHSLIINLDRKPTKYVPVGQTTLAKKNTKTIPIKGSFGKRTITATYYNCYIASRGISANAIDLRWEDQKMPPKFPEKFSLSYNKTHYSNEKEACNFIEEILQPYNKKVIERENLPVDHKTFVIMDVFKGQVTPMVLNLCKESNIVVMLLPVCKHDEFSSATIFDR